MESSPGRHDLDKLMGRDKTPRRVWTPGKSGMQQDGKQAVVQMASLAAEVTNGAVGMDRDDQMGATNKLAVNLLEEQIDMMSKQIAKLQADMINMKAEVDQLKKKVGSNA